MKNLIALLLVFLTAISVSYGQTFEFYKGHTFVGFSVNRFATVDVQGRFNDFSGTVAYDKKTKLITEANFSIDVKSIDTGHEVRDGHLLGEWLNAEMYAEITFVSSKIIQTDKGYKATGNLTIHGVTKEISFPFSMNGPMVDPTKNNAIGISASLIIDRQDFGISFSRLLDNGELFIGNNVEIDINALMIQQKQQ
jgi:polyisoprenoid-binding protein YceI